MDSLLANDSPETKKPRKIKDKPEQSTPRSSPNNKTSPSKKVGLKKESPTLKKEVLEALETLEDLPTEVDVKLEDLYDEA